MQYSQSEVLLSHVVCPSICLSVGLSVCQSVCNVAETHIEEKVTTGSHQHCFDFLGVAAIFLLPVSPLQPRRRPFCLILPVQPNNQY